MVNLVTTYSFIIFIRNQTFSKYQKTLSGQIGPIEFKNTIKIGKKCIGKYLRQF